MRTYLVLIITGLSAIIMMCSSRYYVPGAYAAEQTSRAGWYGILPHIDGYRKTFSRPEIGNSGHWWQTVHFQNSESPDKSVDIIISSRPMKLANSTIVRLGDNGGIMSFKSAGLNNAELQAFVKKFDANKIGSSIQKPPRRDFTLRKSTFTAIPKGANYLDVVDWVGESPNDIGSGIYIKLYKLADGGQALVGTSDLKKVRYINFGEFRSASPTSQLFPGE
ncbi:MAG: hypothetical protein K2W95_36080 [Candidatus Obscuribacterales bacterium]|nr:hypothetical protein [Candidatus Obscuribacterales bacterium]